MSPVRIGTILKDGEEYPVAPEPSSLRLALLARLRETKAAAFDQDAEQMASALLSVMDWHEPWVHFEQIFRPTYLGTRYLGPGCRTCGTMPMADCLTVQTIAQHLGVEG